MPSTALIEPLPANKFLNKLVSNVPNNIPKNLPLCYFTSFLIVSLTPFINKADSTNGCNYIHDIIFIFSFETVSIVALDPNFFIE